jgi:hypothetical protein
MKTTHLNFGRFLSIMAAFGLGALFFAANASADYERRLSLGVGFIHMENPAQTDFTVGAEYESRVDPFLGLGGFANAVFYSPTVYLVGLPELFVHPFGTEWYLNGAPIAEFGGPSGFGTHFGFRLGTRIPIPLGIFTFVPTFDVDFINGGRNYLIGLGLEF